VRYFTFNGYLLRSAVLSDIPLAAAWTDSDPDHAGRVPPRFWIADDSCWLLSDRDGPVFFFRGIRIAERILEIHVQFAPNLPRERLVSALLEGMAWLETNAQNVDEICFDSKNERLISFCEKRLGFVNTNGKLCKRLPIAEMRV
jgi:hypothetical protein